MSTTEIKHILSDKEITELAQKLAAEIRHYGAVQSDKKATLAMFKADLEEIDKKIQDISGKIMTGYDMKTVECVVDVDYTTNKRTYRDPDSGEILKIEDMDTPQPTIFEVEPEEVDEEHFRLLPSHEEVLDD
jgi:hypothetical protein